MGSPSGDSVVSKFLEGITQKLTTHIMHSLFKTVAKRFHRLVVVEMHSWLVTSYEINNN